MEYQVEDLAWAKLHLILRYQDVHRKLIHRYNLPLRVLQQVEKIAYTEAPAETKGTFNVTCEYA